MQWQTITLGQAANSSSGTWGKPPVGDDTDTPVLRSTNIHDGRLVLDDLAMRSLTSKLIERYCVVDGDIIVTTSSGSSQLIGKCTIFQQPPDGRTYALSNFTLRLRPRPTVVLPRFLYYYLLSPAAKHELAQIHTTTSGLRNLNVNLYLRQPLPLTAKSEQQRIVEILDQADALRQQRRAADDKASRILPALFHKHIGDPGLNPKNWPLVELSKFGSPLSGGGFPLDEQGHAEGEYPFIKVSDMNSPGNEVYIRSANHWVSGETLQRLRVKAAPAGTTIFPKIGAAVATNKKRLLVQDTAYDNNVIGVVPHKPEWANYIFAFFLLFDLRRLTRTTALPSIKTSELAALPIPKPSDDVIGAFDSQFRQLLSYQEAQRRSAEQINRLFEVLLHRAFSGDLTAKWREANKAQLEAELEQQMAALGEADADSPRRGRKRKAVN